MTTRPDGQVVLRVFPADHFGWLLLNGLTADVWMHRDVTTANLDRHVATFYRQEQPKGRVALVLGAGNVNAIPPLDALYKLYAEGQVAIVKMNPINDYLGPLLEEAFAPLIDTGYLRIVYGGGDVGAYLAGHDSVDTVHVTGSARTYDAIVFGAGVDGAERKRLRRPALAKPITSELGGGPVHRGPGPVEPRRHPLPGGEHRDDEAPQQRLQLRGLAGARAAAAGDLGSGPLLTPSGTCSGRCRHAWLTIPAARRASRPPWRLTPPPR